MDATLFKMPLYLPAQGATEVEATIVEWRVAEGDRFQKGNPLAQIDSAKSVYDFEAPCDGRVVRLMLPAGGTLPITEPVMEIETADASMRDWIPPAAAAESESLRSEPAPAARPEQRAATIVLLGFGGYLPERLVTNEELVADFPDIDANYIHQVTGIHKRRWAAADEKPSDMAYRAALQAIDHSPLEVGEIDAVVVATTTPDVAMPSTAAILQDRLGLRNAPGFDLNAACSGWLYAIAMAQGMILSGTARNVLTIGVDMQSKLLDRMDRSAYFLFGDGAGATIVSAFAPGSAGHRINRVVLGSDIRGLHLARRLEPGYTIRNGESGDDPWIRIDGPALFRAATDNFASVIIRSLDRSGWKAEDIRWVIPHQANGRILKAAAKKSRVGFDRFYLNVDQVGNTSSASIPLAIIEMENGLQPGDKLVLCSVGAGLTTAAITLEW
ncbi:MAG: beta-ketoacyl-ACP synthase 3 [Pirellulaceae bacterium]|nr:beta-ketoacyl-ACP synthase 3 [Pirellulaceae bacterium]